MQDNKIVTEDMDGPVLITNEKGEYLRVYRARETLWISEEGRKITNVKNTLQRIQKKRWKENRLGDSTDNKGRQINGNKYYK